MASIRHLTNEERDQIDLQARVILTRCSDRVKEMEIIEKRMQQVVLGMSLSIYQVHRSCGNCCKHVESFD